MAMLDIHAEALASGNIAYHEFLLCYRAAEQVVYGLVEGREDPCFYRGLIENLLPTGWEVTLIAAGSKKKVLKAFEGMNWSRFSRKRICFFVDRDLSELLGGETHAGDNLYVTDNYSIESEVVCGRTFERVLEEILGVTNLQLAQKAAILNIFETSLDIFRDVMCPVMAQIVLWRRAGADVALNNIEPKEFFAFTNCRIGTKPEFALPYDRVVHAAAAVNLPPAPPLQIASAEAEFRSRRGLEKFTRGKYLLWFFVRLAKEIHQAAPMFCAHHKVPPKARVELGTANVMAVVAPRARCPPSLKAFLERNFSEYITAREPT